MGFAVFLEKNSMRFYKIIILKIYLFMLFWFVFYNFVPPLILASKFETDERALYYSLSSVIFFTIGYLIYLLKHKKKSILLKNTIQTYQVFYLYLFTLGLYLLFGSFFAIFYAVMAAIFTVKLFDEKKYMIAIIIILITFLLLILEFTRMYILVYVLYIFFTYYLRNKKLHILKIIVVSLLSISLLTSMLYIRGNEKIEPSVMISIVQNNPEIFLKMIDIYYVYNVYTMILKTFPKHHDYIYGASLIKPFVFWIPRFIWKDKPESLPAYIGRYYYGTSRGNNYSTGMTITGEFYINGGVIGIIVFSFLFGLISACFAKQYLESEYESSKIISMIYFVLFPSLMRGGIAATVIMFFLLILFVLGAFKLKHYFKRITLFHKYKKKKI